MKSAETSDDDAFLNDLADPESGALGLEAATQGLPEPPIDGESRARILGQLCPYQRFARFEHVVAELLQISTEDAASALRRIDDATAWQEQLPGAAYLAVPSGPDAGFLLTGFLRVDAGLTFPPHEHLGEEVTYVLQGAFEESHSGQVFRPGQPSRMPAGSRHTFRVLADGPNLIGLVTLKVGARFVVEPVEPGTEAKP